MSKTLWQHIAKVVADAPPEIEEISIRKDTRKRTYIEVISRIGDQYEAYEFSLDIERWGLDEVGIMVRSSIESTWRALLKRCGYPRPKPGPGAAWEDIENTNPKTDLLAAMKRIEDANLIGRFASALTAAGVGAVKMSDLRNTEMGTGMADLESMVIAALPSPEFKCKIEKDLMRSRWVVRIKLGLAVTKEYFAKNEPWANSIAEFRDKIREACKRVTSDGIIDKDKLTPLIEKGTTFGHPDLAGFSFVANTDNRNEQPAEASEATPDNPADTWRTRKPFI